MNRRYFTLVRKDVLDNKELSFGAIALYCLICYDCSTFLRRLLLDKNTRNETIEYSKELEKFGYAGFSGLEEVKDKDSYIGLHISYQPSDSFKAKIDEDYEKIKKCTNYKEVLYDCK